MKTGKTYYAWAVCFACFIMFMCNMGLLSNGLTVYLPYIEENGLSHSMGSAILTVRTMFAFFALFFVGVYYRKMKLRGGILAASLLGAAAMVVFGIARSPFLYYLAAAMAGSAYAAGSVYPTSLLLNNWFHSRRGFAVGLSSAGSGLATMLFAPVIARLIIRHSLRTAFFAEAAVLAALAGLVWFIVRDTPEEKGLLPYGEENSEKKTETVSFGEDLSRGMLWLLAAMMLLNGGAGLAFSGHLSVLAKACGYTGETAAGAVSVFGMSLLTGKLLAGGISDRIGTRQCSTLLISIFILGCICVLRMDGNNLFWPYVMTGLVGFGAAVYNVGPPLWSADLSGKGKYAKTLRWLQIFYNLGGTVFTIVPGVIADHTGEYRSSYILFAGMMFLSACMLHLAYKNRTPLPGRAVV